MLLKPSIAYLFLAALGLGEFIWDAAEKGGTASQSVLLLAGVIILGLVIVALDRRSASNLKLVIEHHDKFVEQVRKERDERNKERMEERAVLLTVIRENTAAFSAIKEVIASRGNRT
jgi:hypothetical protein